MCFAVHEWREHTAELELFVRAATAEDVFGEAAEAFGRLVELTAEGDPAQRRVTLEGRDFASLLVGFLDELIYLADTGSFIPDEARIELLEGGLSAALEGRVTEIQPIVKAATYHQLEFRERDGAWEARVVLDV
jgi:SHS2 domain-containing protein